MGYQKPKPTHPWKTGIMPGYFPRVEKKVKPVEVFVKELVGSWKTIEIFTYYSGGEGKYLLKDLPQRKQAAWLAGLLKRSYDTI